MARPATITGVLRRSATTSAVVVDDWPLVRVGVTRVLQSVDVRVIGEADTTVEGIRLARSGSVDLFIVGEPLQGQQADAVRQAKEAGPVLVVVLVTQASREQLAALLEAGADGLVSRAIATHDLADAVSRVLDGERVVSPSLLPSLVGLVKMADGSGGAESNGVALTAKELEVLRRLAEGRSNKEIAEAIFVTPATVKTHLAHIYAKLGVPGRHEALARAVALGLLS